MSYDRNKIKTPKQEFLDVGCPSPHNDKYIIRAEHPNGGISILFNHIKYFQQVGEWFYNNQEILSSKQNIKGDENV